MWFRGTDAAETDGSGFPKSLGLYKADRGNKHGIGSGKDVNSATKDIAHCNYARWKAQLLGHTYLNYDYYVLRKDRCS